jgi:hypothetical protein
LSKYGDFTTIGIFLGFFIPPKSVFFMQAFSFFFSEFVSLGNQKKKKGLIILHKKKFGRGGGGKVGWNPATLGHFGEWSHVARFCFENRHILTIARL